MLNKVNFSILVSIYIVNFLIVPRGNRMKTYLLKLIFLKIIILDYTCK